jgi:hypothetical protein
MVALVAVIVAVGSLGRGDDTAQGAEAGATTSTLFEFVTTDTSAPPATDAPEQRGRTPPSVPSGQYLLGQEVGLWLFIGGEGPMRRVDLDTGSIVDFGIDAVPIIRRGGDVVVYLPTAGLVGWVSASLPGEQSLSWKPGATAAGPEQEQLWILLEPEGEGDTVREWRLHDTITNIVLERRPVDLAAEFDPEWPAAPTARSSALRPGPDVYTDVDGSVVRADGDRTRRLLDDGRVVVADDDKVLIESCDGSACRLRWVDRSTGRSLDLPTPETDGDRPAARVASGELLASGRWLRTVAVDGTVELIDLVEDRRLAWDVGGDATISPDGRWMVERGGDQLAIFDTEATNFPDRRLPVRVLDDLTERGRPLEMLVIAQP